VLGRNSVLSSGSSAETSLPPGATRVRAGRALGDHAAMTLNPATAQARVLVDELARCGVAEAVVAPGSRSAPLALALHADERIRLHVRVDERSASFLALGLAKASGRPVPVVCTSGTAAAALHPAVAEADLAHVGLLVLTADRPPELRGTGANQTIDQVGLFGRAVRLFAEVGVAEPIPGQVAYWRSLVGRAYGAAADGPVHLNVPFREPLVPRPGDADATWPEPLDGRTGGHPWVRVERFAPEGPDLAALLGGPPGGDLPERGVVVAGDGVLPSQAYDVLGLAGAAGWPLLAEPTSGVRQGPAVVDAYPLLLADAEFAATPPDVVVTVGKPGLSRSTLAWIARAGCHVVVDPHGGWADPTRTAAVVLQSVPTTEHAGRESAWLDRWRAAAAAAVAALDEVLDATGALSEPRVARDLAAAVPPGGLLFTGPAAPSATSTRTPAPAGTSGCSATAG
jgi:2-succinyl-5-enolpyruvyl-6-hydroxy-3-cyclohexene-1-carboxylate synthase